MLRTWSKLADLSRALLLATHRAVCLGLCAEVNLYRRQACFGVRGLVSRVSPLQELYEAFIDCRINNVKFVKEHFTCFFVFEVHGVIILSY